MWWRYGILTACVAGVGAQKTPLEYVNPLIGTVNGGMYVKEFGGNCN